MHRALADPAFGPTRSAITGTFVSRGTTLPRGKRRLDGNTHQGQPGQIAIALESSMLGLNYAGIAFSFRGPSALLELMHRAAHAGLDASAYDSPLDAALTAAEPELARETAACHVECDLHDAANPAADLEAHPDRGSVRWEWNTDQGCVSTLTARARLWRLGTDYGIEARLSSDYRSAHTLLGALYGAVLHNLGGFILHSASVLRSAGIVAFVGPSGAGKSTACRHMQEPIFSIDRMAVLPRLRESRSASGAQPGGHAWCGYPLPGGTLIDPRKVRAAAHWSPLQAILRVRRATGEPQLEDCSAASAVALLRESVFHGCPGVRVETEILERLERLTSTVPVGRVHFRLGPSLTPAVSRWLRH